MNKAFYFFAGVLSTILIVAVFSLVSAKWFWEKDNTQLGPSLTINAHECRADSVCEVNALSSGTNIILQDPFNERNSWLISREGGEGNGTRSEFIIKNLRTNRKVLIFENGGNMRLLPESGVVAIQTWDGLTGSLFGRTATFTDLRAQNRSAYVCTTSEGTLFSSLKPCV